MVLSDISTKIVDGDFRTFLFLELNSIISIYVKTCLLQPKYAKFLQKILYSLVGTFVLTKLMIISLIIFAIGMRNIIGMVFAIECS